MSWRKALSSSIGLKVLMAFLNNWDLKDVNNAVYADTSGEVYAVGDLGGTFGPTHFVWPREKARDNFEAYRDSKFITLVTPEYVSFGSPARPTLLGLVALPDFLNRLRMRWIGRQIPIADVRWIGSLLGRLSTEQIGDAFRAGGFAPDEVDGFTRVVQGRIAALNSL